MKLIIFDIDGTLADPGHRLHHILEKPKDYESFFQECLKDPPIEEGVNVAHAIWRAGFDVEFWTGRPERIREKTRTWLNWRVGVWTEDRPLRMRPDDDHRPDQLVKTEYLNQINRTPHIIFEDRAKVVKAFREKSITVYQVVEGNY